MLALLSTSHDYLFVFLGLCFLVLLCLGLLAICGVAGLVARWDLRRRHPELFPDRPLRRAQPCDLSEVRRDHFDLASRHRAEEETWGVAS